MQPTSAETGKVITNRRAIANDLLTGKVDLRAYPHRYLAVSAHRHSGGLPSVLAAVEWLEAHGWELVNLFMGDDIAFNALIRRRPA